jgi:hypothetical protein
MFDLFWKDDFSILYNADRLTEFFPSDDMNFNEKLNALVRLCTYAGILLYLYHKKNDYLYLPVIMMSVSLFLHNMHSYERNEQFEIIKKTPVIDNTISPSTHNPFMNFNIMNNTNDQEKQPINNDPKLIENKFNEGLYKNADDVFDKSHSDRQYFSMPWTGPSNEQGDYSKWLYNNLNNTCKIDQDKCQKSINEDLRVNKPIV